MTSNCEQPPPHVMYGLAQSGHSRVLPTLGPRILRRPTKIQLGVIITASRSATGTCQNLASFCVPIRAYPPDILDTPLLSEGLLQLYPRLPARLLHQHPHCNEETHRTERGRSDSRVALLHTMPSDIFRPILWTWQEQVPMMPDEHSTCLESCCQNHGLRRHVFLSAGIC